MKLCLPCGERFDALSWNCPRCGRSPLFEHGSFQFAPELAVANDGFRAEHFSELLRVEDHHFWFRNRNRIITWALQKYAPRAHNFLEVGCGTGFVLKTVKERFPDMDVQGGELFRQGLEIARRRVGDAVLYQMDATRIPFESEFDALGCFDVLEHVGDDQAVLRQMARALKPKGTMIITVPQHPSLWSAADAMACHKRRYTRSELVNKLGATGLEIVRLTSFMTSLLPLVWISRRFEKKTKSVSGNKEFQVNRYCNYVLELILRAEATLLLGGFDLPFGVSLLAVARTL